MSDREMYYNISNTSNIRNTSNTSNTFHSSEMSAGPEVPEPVRDGRPLGSASPSSGSDQEKQSVAVPQVRFEWITAQWAFRRQSTNPNPAQRIAVAMTFMLPEEIGTRQQPHKITFYLTDRWREFQPGNPFQRHIHTMAGLRGVRWIGKARLRQRRGQEVTDHHRRNIPDLVMTADIADADTADPWLQARLWTPLQQIDLDFRRPLTEGQRRYYEGAAAWGRVPRARDDFGDWIRYA